MALFDWLRNLWGPTTRSRPRPKAVDLYETADYPPVPAVTLSAGNVRLRAGVYTTVGNVREHNEDNYYVPGAPGLNGRPAPLRGVGADAAAWAGGASSGSSPPPADEPPSGPPAAGTDRLFIVADGMGGQMAGERASQMAVDIIPVELSKRLPPESRPPDERAVRAAVRDAVGRANEEILAQSHLDTDCNNMGTTVVLALFRDDRAYVTGIGDSRVYRLRDGRLEMLTEDHSLARALEKAGTIRADEVEGHKFKHVLYLYLGSRDVGAGPEEVRSLDVRPGDRFLMATDGLTGVVGDGEIADLLARVEDPQKAAEELVQRAIEAQSKDNITCVVVHVV